MAGDPTYIQSLAPAGAKPVATTIRHYAGANSLAVQHMIVVDASSDVQLTVRSLAGGNPIAVSLTDSAGSPTSTIGVVQGTIPWTVTGSVAATQASSPWITQAGSTGSPQGTVVASLIGVPTVIGSVQATQATSPWVTRAGSTADPQGTVVASVIGAIQAVGSVNATQTTSPWITRAGSTGAPQGTIVASVIGVPTVIGSVQVTQATSPWATQLASGGQFIGFVVASLVGGGSTVTGTVTAILTTSAGVALSASSYGGDGPLLRIDLVRGSLSAGADGALLDGGDATVKATVRSHAGGNPLAVILTDAVGATTSAVSVAGTVVASIVGVATVTGSVQATQATSPWITRASSNGAPLGTIVASVIGQPTATASVIGQVTVTASVVGAPTVVASLIGVPTIVGSVGVTQVTSPWIVQIGSANVPLGTIVASVVGQATVTASLVGVPTVVGSVVVTQATSPWVVLPGSTGAPQGTVVASVIGQATVTASVIGQPTVTASLIGAPTVVASVIGVAAIVGSAGVTQVTSPWVVLPGSTGAPQGTVVASVIGQATVTASVIGAPSVVASVIGQPTVTASVVGVPTVIASIAGTIATAAGAQYTLANYGTVTYPAQFLQVTPTTGAAATGWYPSDGSARVGSGSTSTTIQLDVSSAPGWQTAGMLVVVLSSTVASGTGQIRVVTSMHVSSKIATVQSAWTATPVSGDYYALLVPCYARTALHIRTEFEVPSASGGVYCDWTPVYFDFGRGPRADGALGVEVGAARMPLAIPGETLTVENLSNSFFVVTSGHYLGRGRTEQIQGGMLGAKLLLSTLPSSGRVVAWLAAV